MILAWSHKEIILKNKVEIRPISENRISVISRSSDVIESISSMIELLPVLMYSWKENRS